MSSFNQSNGSNQNFQRRFPNNPSNQEFSNMDPYENQYASRGNTMASYNQQSYNYNQQQYSRSSTMTTQQPMNNYMSQPQQSKHGFSSMFKKKNGSKKDSGFDKDDDEDVMLGNNENIVSFNDISGFRKAGGPAYGYNNSSDTAPIIPTVLTTGTNVHPGKMNNTTYRKMLTNQKKSALSQYNKQLHEEAGTPRAMSMQSYQPRAMTFQNGQQFRPPQGIPGPPPFGSKNGTPYGSRSNSMMNGMRQNTMPNKMYPQNQFPSKAMTMAQGNKAPFMQQPQMMNPNYRANSMQMRSVPPQGNYQVNNGSYFQQQQQLYGVNQGPQQGAYKDQHSGAEGANLTPSYRDQYNDVERTVSRPTNEENVGPGETQDNNHKKTESIKLRPNSALIKGLDTNDEELHEDFRPILENAGLMETPKHAHKNSMISFNSPIPENTLVKKNREFYQMGKGVNTTGDFVTAQELPLNDEFEFGNKQNDTSTDSVSIKSKTKKFFKRMSGISAHSRSNSNLVDQAHDFKVHSVVKTSDDAKSEGEKKMLMAAKNRGDFTFKASRTSLGEISNMNNTNQSDVFNKRQSYHSLFSNEDIDHGSKPRAIQEEEAADHESNTNETIYEEDNVNKSPTDLNSSIYDHEETKQNVSLDSFKVADEPESGVNTDIRIEHDNEMQQKLMKEIFILSEELTESIVRETDLERRLLSSRGVSSVGSSPAKKSASGQLNLATTSMGLLDVQLELRKKSKNIVQLIKDLNEERMKRFIAEQEVLNVKNGCKPDYLELSYKYKKMESELAEKNETINSLREKLESGL